MNIDDEVFKNFLAEMADRLIDLEQGLQELENQFSIDVINKLFRAVHTIKGGCGFFSLTKITELSHLFEDILMKIREGLEREYVKVETMKEEINRPQWRKVTG